MAKKEITLEGNMALVSIGYKTFVFPWADGLKFFDLFQNAHCVSSEYDSNTKKSYWYMKGADADVSIKMFTPEEQAQLLMGGPNVKSDV